MRKGILLILLTLVLILAGAPGCKTPPVDHYKNALELDQLSNYTAAIDEYTLAIAGDPNDAILFFNRGNDYFRTLQFDLAIADYTRTIQLKPDDNNAYFQRGVAYINKGFKDASFYKLAIFDFTKAIFIDSNDAKAYDNRGYAYALDGQYELAKTDLNKAIALSNDVQITQHAQKILGQIEPTAALPQTPTTTVTTTPTAGPTGASFVNPAGEWTGIGTYYLLEIYSGARQVKVTADIHITVIRDTADADRIHGTIELFPTKMEPVVSNVEIFYSSLPFTEQFQGTISVTRLTLNGGKWEFNFTSDLMEGQVYRLGTGLNSTGMESETGALKLSRKK